MTTLLLIVAGTWEKSSSDGSSAVRRNHACKNSDTSGKAAWLTITECSRSSAGATSESRNGTRSCCSISSHECVTTGSRRCESTCEPPRPGNVCRSRRSSCILQPVEVRAREPRAPLPASRRRCDRAGHSLRSPPLRSRTGAKFMLKPSRRSARAESSPNLRASSVRPARRTALAEGIGSQMSRKRSTRPPS